MMNDDESNTVKAIRWLFSSVSYFLQHYSQEDCHCRNVGYINVISTFHIGTTAESVHANEAYTSTRHPVIFQLVINIARTMMLFMHENNNENN